MKTYITRRMLQGLVVLFIVSFIAFFIFQYLGDPVLTLAGRYATEEQREEVRRLLNLDQPFYVQYLSFISNAVRGNFGMSYVSRVPVARLIIERLPASIELAVAAELFAVIVGISLVGIFVAAKPYSLASKFFMTGSLISVSLPTFMVGILLILLFSITINILPPTGRGSLVNLFGRWRSGFFTLDGLKHLIMPALTLGMFQMALLFRITRGAILEVLGADFIRTARAKGLSSRIVLYKHALRNALIPVITMIGLQFGQLIGFAIVTESIFQWPGAGSLPFLLGTDMQGRDVFSTILYGSRTSLFVGISVVIIAGGFGAFIGLLAGYYGGILDTIIMRFGDTVFSFSQTLIAMLLLGVFRQSSVLLVIAAICISGWVQYARTIRGQVLSVKEKEYILSSRAIGCNDFRIIIKHVLPNSISPLLVIAAVHFGMAIMLEATLSFLGVGVPVTQPSLGMMISQGRDFLYAGNWWLVIFPGGVLMSIVFSLNLIADWLRDEFDPRIKNLQKS